ncbi:hypothetical protein [Devosia sp.]|uniref:hypothetical protein n=1 Tax=Devosia sp. TaxID=1871048 RepID=UPI00292D3CE8|nr:hypothetical protein [Devosia sp.]
MANPKNSGKDGETVDSTQQISIRAAAPDLGQYREHLAHMSLPREREDEILHAIWTMMASFVDRAWDDDPVQHAGIASDANERNDSYSLSDAFAKGAIRRRHEN